MLWHLWYHWLGLRLSLLDLASERTRRSPKYILHVQTNGSRTHTSNHHLYQTLADEANISPAINQPGSGTSLEIVSLPKSPQKVFKPASLIFSILVCLAFPTETPIKASLCLPVLFASWLPLVPPPHVAQHDMPCLLFLRIYEYELIYSWHSFPHLHILPYLMKANLGYKF